MQRLQSGALLGDFRLVETDDESGKRQIEYSLFADVVPR
jgi:hypothetical protein